MHKPYLLPEWAPQSAILITWPHAQTDWALMLNDIEPYYTNLALSIAEYQGVLIVCYDEALKHRLQKKFKQHPNIDYVIIKTNDTWIRDYGPITINKNKATTYLDFTFNAWGGKFESDHDNLVNQQLFQHDLFNKNKSYTAALTFEGGAMETNSEVLLTTASCALDPKRNTDMTKTRFKQKMQEYFACHDVIILEHGHLVGDDTDGHIDTIVRFCDQNTLCYVACDDPHHPNYEQLKQLEQELQALPFHLVKLPQPEVILGKDNQILPATYANFLITNESVLVPTYGQATDDTTISILQNCFPKHQMKGIDCRALIEQNGSLHCSTMQLPK